MAVSMHDVARLAGVSQRTVSNVVNDYVHVSSTTRQRVEEAIRTLHYRPNVSAQKLRNGRTGIVALAVPEIAAPYFAELADHIQRYATRQGVTLLIDQTGGTRERELLVLDGYQSNIIDGLILSPISITAEDLARRPLDVPVVLLGESIDHSGYLHVSIDNVGAARTATRHLVGLGRTRIVALGAHRTGRASGPEESRRQGYVRALEEAGLLPATTLPVESWTRASGYAAVSSLLDSEQPVDGLFCFNDALALGALKALADRGVRVPEQVAVVGWDDIEEAAYATPALTTIAPPKVDIATRAVDGLLASIRGEPPDSTEISCDYELRVRASS